jgi:tetratricopeptide (TPR) repeat protein
LPADVAAFTGRGPELAQLDGFISTSDDSTPTAVVISTLSGSAGVGKTALAIHWAHRVAHRFPDGQLYVNLRGYDPDQPVDPADALARFLTALGVADPDIPIETDARAARYRTETAGRRMLIVLDNASTVEQVRPLLPGTPSCPVLVTSRDSLAGLVALHGATRLDLDLLPPADAIALLRRLIGSRAEADPAATSALAGRCARLPLALRVAAELATSRAHTPLADLVTELADQQRRLDLLDAGGDPRAAVTAVFSWSIRQLPPDAARTFRLLGLHPGPDFDAYATAALAGADLRRAHRHLDLLDRAHLIRPSGAGRYGMHDLLRAYAARLTGGEPDDSQAALGRLFDHYLATAAVAMDALDPAHAPYRPPVRPASTPAPVLADPEVARGWLDAERAGLVAVAAYTASRGWPTHTVALSTTLFRYFGRGHYLDGLAIHRHAYDAARRARDPIGQARALHGLGSLNFLLGRLEPAADQVEMALAMFQRAGDERSEARALGLLGRVETWLGRFGSAAGHHQRALALFRQTGDRTGEAHVLTGLGNLHRRLGRHQRAIDHQRQALRLFRLTGDRYGEATALAALCHAELSQGQLAPALDHCERSLALYRELADRGGEATALAGLGTIHILLGHLGQGAAYQREALTLFREIGDQARQAEVLNSLGEAALAAGHLTEAVTRHTDALTLTAGGGDGEQQARAHLGLARANECLGNPAGARAHYEHALALYTDLGMPEADDVRTQLAATA